MKHVARWVLILTMAAAAAACSTNGEQGGPTERTAANAGRVVDDSVITGKVKAALVADETTKAHQISVETFNGVVQLSGFVDSSRSAQPRQAGGAAGGWCQGREERSGRCATTS